MSELPFQGIRIGSTTIVTHGRRVVTLVVNTVNARAAAVVRVAASNVSRDAAASGRCDEDASGSSTASV